MDKKELNKIIKQHPDVKGFRRTAIGIAVVCFIASIVLLFINRVIGIIGLCILPILILLYWIAYKGKIRNIRKHIDEYGIDWVEPQNNMSAQSRSVKENNPIVDVATSYAIGKAVTNKAKQSPLAENPYQKKQTASTQATSRESTSKYVSKMGKTHQCCGTCQHWRGGRELDAANHGRIANIISKDGECTCKASSKCRMAIAYNKTCTEWEKWSDLK